VVAARRPLIGFALFRGREDYGAKGQTVECSTGRLEEEEEEEEEEAMSVNPGETYTYEF